jgi:hypothetical protein
MPGHSVVGTGPGAVFLVHAVGPVDQARALHDRRDAGMRHGGMHLVPMDVDVIGSAALVARDDAPFRRLPDDGERGLGHTFLHMFDHRRRADAADLLIPAEAQLQGPRHAAPFGLHRRPDGERVEPLHVAGPAPVELAVLLDDRERIVSQSCPSVGTTSVWPDRTPRRPQPRGRHGRRGSPYDRSRHSRGDRRCRDRPDTPRPNRPAAGCCRG